MGFAAQRHETIMREVRTRGSVKVTDIVRQFKVSAVTVRRDLAELAERGLLHRVYGGATLPTTRESAPAERGASRTGFRFTAGMIVPSATYYYPAVIRGAELAAKAMGARLVLGISQYNVDEERNQVERLARADVDGLLLATCRAPDDDDDLAELLNRQTRPVVLVERSLTRAPAGPSIEYVRTDHEHGAHLAVTHLAAQGHQRIGLAVLANTPTTPWLVRGHASAMSWMGLSLADVPVRELPREDRETPRYDRVLDELLDTCTSSGTRALLVHPDQDAVRLTQLARARGLAVPEDLSIVTYDDEVAALADVPLTAVAPPKEDVGRTAVELLCRRLETRQRRALRHVSLLPELNVRESCGARTTHSSP